MSNDEEYQRQLRDREVVQRHLDQISQSAIDAVAAEIGDTLPRLKSRFFYGVSAIHPRHLVTWYLFAKDSDLEEAKRIGLTDRIDRLTREHLEARGYPPEAISLIHVSFTTDEDIQRETGGDYWSYFK